MSLTEALLNETERCNEILQAYKEIGTPGTFAAIMIKEDLRIAKKALNEVDVVKMIEAYEKLKEYKF